MAISKQTSILTFAARLRYLRGVRSSDTFCNVDRAEMPRTEKRERRRVAEQLCSLFHEALRHAVSNLTHASGSRIKTSKELHEVSTAERGSFMRAARVCIDNGYDPREFVVAQFSAYRAASAYHRKFLLPKPTNLDKTNAQINYIQFKASDAERIARRTTVDDDDGRRFFVEERRLRGLARMQRRSEADVLAEQPEQFSRDFLKHKLVWDVVKDAWDERRGS